MQAVSGRLLQPTVLLVGLLVVALLAAALVLMWPGGANDAEQLVGPFRWNLMRHIG